jgi:hypothetical protein
MTPRFLYNDPSGAPNASAVGIGDLTLQAGYALTQFHDGSRMPADRAGPAGDRSAAASRASTCPAPGVGVPISAFQSASGSPHSIGFAPAIEYNLASAIGALLGVRIIEIGRNASGRHHPGRRP